MTKKLIHISSFFLPVLCLCLAMSVQNAFADKIDGISLGAQDVRDTFNAINGGNGYYFREWAPPRNDGANDAYGVTELEHYDGGVVDLSAYSGNIWMTFCCQPDTSSYYTAARPYGPGGYYSGKLSYESNGSYVTSNRPNPAYLTVGAAYLYTQYIVGDLSQRFTDIQVGDALRYLMGYQEGIGNIRAWSDSPVLRYLTQSINSNQNYWRLQYNPDAYYTEIGNYSVFILNVLGQPGNHYTQDLLYLARHIPTPGDVPEPATILLWTLGSLGTIGFARRRPNMLKNA